jgi:hypothetical protein
MTAIKKNSVPVWVTNVLPIILAVVAATLYIEHRFGGISDRLLKVEEAVRTLGNSQNDPLKTIIHDLLAVAANPATAPATAAKATDSASILLVALRDKKKEADPNFFLSTVASLDKISTNSRSTPEVVEASFKARTSLANYRSALEPTPVGINVLKFEKMEHAATIFPNFRITGGNFEVSKVTGDAVEVGKLDPNIHQDKPPALPYIEQALFQNGKQTLDNIEWVNVIFYNMHIRYNGGKLAMKNVTFINCTFEAPPTSRGAQVVDYAALQQTGALTIG